MSKSKIVSYKVLSKASKRFGEEGVFVHTINKSTHVGGYGGETSMTSLRFKDGKVVQFATKNLEKVSK